MFYLEIAGSIPEHKQKEFEQTFKLVSGQLPKSCTGFLFCREVEKKNVYHFISYWEQQAKLEKFTNSSSCIMLLGAFRTLGELLEDKVGVMMEIKGSTNQPLTTII